MADQRANEGTGVRECQVSRFKVSGGESLGGDLGDYEILSEIARGGMGVVFKARSRRLKRIVALKLVHVTTASRASMRQRFLFEAEIAAGLDHPNIVPVYEFGESDGRHLFCADGDLLMVLEAATGKVLHTAAGRHMAGLWLDDRRLLLGGTILWGADRGDATEIFDVVSGETRVIPKRRHAPFAMSADGRWLAWVRIGQAGSEIQILKSSDLESPNPTILRTISTRVMDAGLLAFSGDGRHLIQCLGDTTGLMGHLEVVSLETGEVMFRQAFPAQIRGIATDPSEPVVAFHPDGRRLFVGNEDGWVRVFDVGTRQELPAEGWRAQTGAVTALAVSGDGNVVATSGDRTLRFWEAVPGREPGLMRRERMQVNVPTARNWMRFGDGDRVLLHCAPGQPLEAWEAP